MEVISGLGSPCDEEIHFDQGVVLCGVEVVGCYTFFLVLTYCPCFGHNLGKDKLNSQSSTDLWCDL